MCKTIYNYEYLSGDLHSLLIPSVILSPMVRELSVSANSPTTGWRDDRPESWQPILETMRIVGHVDVKHGNWDARLEWIKPNLFHGFAHLQATLF